MRQNNHTKKFKVDWFGGIYPDIPLPPSLRPWCRKSACICETKWNKTTTKQYILLYCSICEPLRVNGVSATFRSVISSKRSRRRPSPIVLLHLIFFNVIQHELSQTASERINCANTCINPLFRENIQPFLNCRTELLAITSSLGLCQ